MTFAGNRGIGVDIAFRLPGINNRGIFLLDTSYSSKSKFTIIVQGKHYWGCEIKEGKIPRNFQATRQLQMGSKLHTFVLP